MDMKPLSAIDMCQRDQSYKSFDPLFSDPSNGPTNPNNQHVSLSPYSAPDADTSHSTVSTAGLLAQAPVGHLENNFVSVQTSLNTTSETVGEDSVQQETTRIQSNTTEFTAANEAAAENAQREIEMLRMSQDRLHQQIESLTKNLGEITSVNGAGEVENEQKIFFSVRASPIITATKRYFESNPKIIRHRSRATNKRWPHIIRMLVFAFCALSWFHLHLLATTSLPTLGTKLEEYLSPRGATEVSLLSKKMKNLKDQLQRVEDEKVYKAGQTVLCSVARNEDPYIDEFVDYHLGLGFGKIIVYDNTEGNELKYWGKSRGTALKVVHHPGVGNQNRAYLNCANATLEGIHGDKKWAAFWDVDEFLVLKEHDNVDDFLGEYLTTPGALGINWYLFGPSGRSLYQPLPVTKRFVCRQNKTNAHVKSFVRLNDMNMNIAPHVHFPYLIHGTLHDTNGRSFDGPLNEGGPSDTAVLHHFRTKSVKEFLEKSIRGRADVVDDKKDPKSQYHGRVKRAIDMFHQAVANDGEQMMMETCHNSTHDDSAWSAMKKIAPKYALYDALAIGEQPPLPLSLEAAILDLEF